MERTDPVSERRMKILRMAPRYLVGLLQMWKPPFPHVVQFRDMNIPDDAILVSVTTDYCSDCILIRVAHETYSPVPEGHEIPFLPEMLEVVNPVNLVELVERYKEQRAENDNARMRAEVQS